MKAYRIDIAGKRTQIPAKLFTFAGGEEHIRFASFATAQVCKVEVVAHLTSSAQVMRLLLAVDALKRATDSAAPIELVIPYFPYARQDRVCAPGEALSAAVMAQLINAMAPSKVTTWDVHSDVVPALVNNLINVEQASLVARCDALCEALSRGQLTLVSPDAGASKKTAALAQRFNCKGVIQASKQRDVNTGAITATQVSGDVAGKDVLIVDDICDGGSTFVELAKVLKRQGVKRILLFVSHGIFSKGLRVFDGLIERVYTTNSVCDRAAIACPESVALTVIDI